MNRRVKQLLWSAVAAMFAVAIAAIAWRPQMPEADAALLRPRPMGPLILLAIPTIVAVMLVISASKLDARSPGLAKDNTQHVQGAMVFLVLFMAACQAWIAFMHIGGVAPGGETLVRGAVLLSAVAMAVRGNFVGKLSPPAVADPPDPALWARAARRMGLGLVALGSLLTVCALVLPLRSLFFVLMGMAAILVGMSFAHRATIKGGRRS